MNKRIRKKHLRRTLCKFLAAYDEYEAARERAFRKALQIVEDAHLGPREEIQCYMKIVSIMASSGPMPRFLSEGCSSIHPSPP